MNKVLAMVLAGGKGERLYPLTEHRAKPAVPFGGIYRLIDFVLSNLVNSGIFQIYVMTQYKAQSFVGTFTTGMGRDQSDEQLLCLARPRSNAHR